MRYIRIIRKNYRYKYKNKEIITMDLLINNQEIKYMCLRLWRILINLILFVDLCIHYIYIYLYISLFCLCLIIC
jgi:hypothetical protein